MSAISLKSITGITSITTPAGVDNQLTLHTNNTTERLKIDIAGNVHVNNHLAVTGVTTTSDDINIPVTNKKLKIGASQQLQLYNQGYHSRIDHVGNHWLSIRSNAIGLFDASDNYFLDGLASSGAVRLYFSNSPKLATTNTGITVTGKLTSDGLVLGDSETIAFGNTSNGDFKIYHDGSNASIQNITGILNIFGGTNSIYLKAKNDENSIVCSPNAQVELYYDGIRTALTQQDALWVHGRTANSGMIEIASNQGANNNDRFRIHKTSAAARLTIQEYSSGSWVENIRITGGGAVELKHSNGTTKFQTTGTGAQVTTTSSANSVKNITTSTSTPSGGSDGDLWFTYVA